MFFPLLQFASLMLLLFAIWRDYRPAPRSKSVGLLRGSGHESALYAPLVRTNWQRIVGPARFMTISNLRGRRKARRRAEAAIGRTLGAGRRLRAAWRQRASELHRKNSAADNRHPRARSAPADASAPGPDHELQGWREPGEPPVITRSSRAHHPVDPALVYADKASPMARTCQRSCRFQRAEPRFSLKSRPA